MYEVLFNGEYLQVISPLNQPYEAVLQPDTIMFVPVLPGPRYGFRLETCPPYQFRDKKEQKYLTVVSGGRDDKESPIETMLRELEEEAGVIALDYSVRPLLERVPINKTLCNRGWFYILDIYDYDAVEAVGDGTIYEAMSETIFVDIDEIPRLRRRYQSDLLFEYFLPFI